MKNASTLVTDLVSEIDELIKDSDIMVADAFHKPSLVEDVSFFFL